ncbi:MAG: zinc ABC transporter substrate-binding protein [Rhodospirillales bacterium]|nr:zinc ABC transporter substrate-binding protein [Rhodospirillales bacterium]
MKALLSGLILLVLSVTGPAAAADRIQVVASFSILGDMVRQVTGDLAEVTTIVGPDADAHVYEPSTSDAKAVAGADVIFVNGLGFETWSSALIETSGGDAQVFVATEGVEPLLVDGEIDPHAWNALTNGMIYVRNIAAGMAKVDAANAATYSANADAYVEQLGKVHDNAVSEFSALPDERRTVVTAHDAFGYLEQAYGLTFLAPVGIDTDAEPSASDLANLIDHLNETGAGALFVENITSPALVEQISRETGLEIGGRLFSDALSEKGGPATSYVAMFEHNLRALITALQSGS